MAQDSISPNVPGLDYSLAFRDARLPGNQQSGASYTPELADIEKVVRFTSAAAATLTVPPHSAVPFPIGTVLSVARDGTGVVSVAAGVGVTLNRDAGTLASIGAQYGLANIRKTAVDVWSLFGGLASA